MSASVYECEVCGSHFQTEEGAISCYERHEEDEARAREADRAERERSIMATYAHLKRLMGHPKLIGGYWHVSASTFQQYPWPKEGQL